MSKVLINYLMILSLSFSNCQDSNTVQTIHLSEGSRVKLNSAYENNNLLSVEWNVFSGKRTFTNFTIRLDNLEDEINDKCILDYYADTDIDTIDLTSIHQLSERHVLTEWKHSRKDQVVNYGTDIRKILIIDILHCKYAKNITYPVSIRKIPKDLIVYYDEGFDVIMNGWDCGAATNCRERYDTHGKKLFDMNFLPLKFSWITWQSVSKKSRSKGLFMRGMNIEENSPTQVYFVKNEVKNLFNLRSRHRVISHVDSELWYVICGEDIYNEELIVCAQYHISKEKVFETRVVLSKQLKFIGVRGLTKGGVLLFAIDGNAKLLIAKMKHGVEAEIENFDLKWDVSEDGDFVIQVDKSEKTFDIVYESIEPKHKVVMETFEFSKNPRKN